MTTPVTAQGPAIQGMSTQQGYAPGFPPPLGIEQYLGQPQQYGSFPQQFYAQQQFPGQQQPQFPGQQQLAGQQGPMQQIVQSLVSQLLPIAHQLILPQVVATATQQIPQHLQQLVAQQVSWQLSQQAGWQQPQFGQQGQSPFGRSYQGSFSDGRPSAAHLSLGARGQRGHAGGHPGRTRADRGGAVVRRGAVPSRAAPAIGRGGDAAPGTPGVPGTAAPVKSETISPDERCTMSRPSRDAAAGAGSGKGPDHDR